VGRELVKSLYLGFDLGSKTGFSTIEVDWTTGIVNPKAEEWQLATHKVERHIDFHRRLNEAIRGLGGFQDIVVCYEKVHRHLGTAAAHVYGAFEMQLLVLTHELSIETLSATPGELKKHATGAGNATKAMMAQAILERHIPHGDIDMESDNAVDAFWIADWAMDYKRHE
jgi:crossover junction endodeoxyribonuclease RuvC